MKVEIDVEILNKTLELIIDLMKENQKLRHENYDLKNPDTIQQQ